MKTMIIEVVAALIQKDDRYLICRRPESKSRALLWEFAGGKVEEGETLFDAVIRECREELDLDVEPKECLCDAYHEYEDISIHLNLIRCLTTDKEPTLKEHVDYAWCTLEQMNDYDLCPADRTLLRKLSNRNRMLFVYNPQAGQLQIKNYLWDIINRFSAEEYDITIKATQRNQDGYRTVCREGNKFDLIVCSGGDGTLNEVINGILTIDKDKRPVLGYIPAGSTNDYATSLNLPKDMIKAADLVVTGNPHHYDMGLFNNRYFVYVAAFGAFTEVSYATDQSIKNMLGHLAYVLSGIRSLTNIKSYHVSIDAGDFHEEGDYIYGMISNSLYVGGIYDLSKKGVLLDDGLLEVMLVRNPTSLDDLGSIISYLLGISEKSDMITVLKAEKIVVKPDSEMKWTLDGEYGGAPEEVVVTVEKQAVAIVVGNKA